MVIAPWKDDHKPPLKTLFVVVLHLHLHVHSKATNNVVVCSLSASSHSDLQTCRVYYVVDSLPLSS